VLTAALAKLPPKHRLAVVLHYLAHLSTSEIARQHNVAEGTVRSWLSRGRAQLAEQLIEPPSVWAETPSVPALGVGDAIARARRRRAVPRAPQAVLVAAAIAVSIAVIVRGKGSEPPFIGPTTPPSAPAPSPSAPTPQQTITALALLAESAPAPPRPRPDQLILMTRMEYLGSAEIKREHWLDPDGAILLRFRSTKLSYGHAEVMLDEKEADRQEPIQRARSAMAKAGPGLNYPNWTVLSAYTNDPQALLAELTRGRSRTAADLVVALREVADRLGALAPPQLNAALLRTFQLVDEVSAELITAKDGSQVWAIGGMQGIEFRREVLVSAANGQIVGERDWQMVTYGCCRGGPSPPPILDRVPPMPFGDIMWHSTLTAR
jgi:hypothetical protein